MEKVISRELFEKVGVDTQNSETVVRPSMSYFQDAWRRLKKNKVAMIQYAFFLIFIALMCVFAPMIYPVAFDTQDLMNTNQGPTMEHFFGLDDLGRDVFARIWVGGRVSLTIVDSWAGSDSHLSLVFSMGGISGYFGGIVDDIMMRIVEILVGIPYMIVVIIVSMVLGKGIHSLLIALCLTSWTGLARLVRGQVISLKSSEYILAAKALGTSDFKIIRKHLFPNMLSVIIINTTFSIPGFIFSEAFLSFLGMGIWGSLRIQAGVQWQHWGNSR